MEGSFIEFGREFVSVEVKGTASIAVHGNDCWFSKDFSAEVAAGSYYRSILRIDHDGSA